MTLVHARKLDTLGWLVKGLGIYVLYSSPLSYFLLACRFGYPIII